MATIAYGSASPNRVSSSTSQNQYAIYSTVNKSILSQVQHQTLPQQHHHKMHSGSTSGAPPLSIYQVREHHSNYLESYSRNFNYKRKSAVEMLAESKPYYVKSETVLDRRQRLNAYGSSNNFTSFALSPSRVPSSPHHSFYHQTSTMERRPRSTSNRRTASAGSDLLQTKLRRLLNTEKDTSVVNDDILIPPPPKNYSEHFHPNRMSGNYKQQLTVHPESQNDVNVFFPSAFLSPQSLPPHPSDDLDILYSAVQYSVANDDEFLERPISPPEQYATNTQPKKGKIKKEKHQYDYQRSISQTLAVDEFRRKSSLKSFVDPYSQTSSVNINSHKSLPDLHTQISRHSPHSEGLSSCSRGNRSNRSGSSEVRDSGGSSGHYTHRSEPCCKQMEKLMMTQQQQPQSSNFQAHHQQEYRRDSGSSTQHSGNSYYTYQQQYRYDCIECRLKMRENETMFNFPVEVPEAFQDGYKEDSNDTLRNTYYNQHSSTSAITRSPSPTSSKDVLTSSSQKVELSPVSPPLGTFKRQKCLRFKNFRYSNSSNAAQTSTSQPNSLQDQTDDDRRPILRSKSDVSDRYWNRVQKTELKAKSRKERFQPDEDGSGESNESSVSMYELEHFFDHLGLDDKNFAEIVRPKDKFRADSANVAATFSDNDDTDQSSVVFFSDCSTVDSNRIIADSGPTNSDQKTLQAGQGNSNLYRPSEPPSIVERNARIIKWLCNCKKLKLL